MNKKRDAILLVLVLLGELRDHNSLGRGCRVLRVEVEARVPAGKNLVLLFCTSVTKRKIDTPELNLHDKTRYTKKTTRQEGKAFSFLDPLQVQL